MPEAGDLGGEKGDGEWGLDRVGWGLDYSGVEGITLVGGYVSRTGEIEVYMCGCCHICISLSTYLRRPKSTPLCSSNIVLCNVLLAIF